MTMMFNLVRPIALNTSQSLSSVGEGSISLLPAVFALENSKVHICTTYSGNVTSDIKAMIDEGLGKHTRLEILYIDLYDSYIGFQ